ncbi:hypothetical protein ACJMK2_019407 [Sinanodonta woodiana]|uniref:FERM, ARHGEF and pleckstrin domain-containing protein 1 n=1 Tax=Sinanodonta woodiana TaxID=1069815 RepID=A0ABD3UGA9_SINWO
MDRKGKQVNLRVIFLDDQVHAFQVHVKAFGQVLWEAVVHHLNLLETDYFDLEYEDAHGLQCWLDREKAILKQLPNPDRPLYFLVKFYTPDPTLLEDELTRYLLALQIKRDLMRGNLPCSENTVALLISYVVQAEIGDYPIEDYEDHTYLSAYGLKYVPNQTEALERKICEYHKQHVGETPAEADANLLDTARKVDLYGIRVSPAKDHEGVPLNLAVASMGILVFQGFTKINTFSWAKIRKLSFKRKKFLIKLHPENYGYYKDLVEFFFETRDECKGFWKKCIEHHTFFRCHTVKKMERHKTRVISRGSSFRYSGRTQKELCEFVRDQYVKRQPFQRTVSGRISSRSTSVTPKIPAKTSSLHNSADLHNSTASSGSHILDQSAINHQLTNQVESVDIHSDSSLSGSRSLGSLGLPRSPKKDEVQGHNEEVAESTNGATYVPDVPFPGAEGTVTVIQEEHRDKVLTPLESPGRATRTPHLLTREDRKMSAPSLGSDVVLPVNGNRLSRSEEVENIPGIVEEENAEPSEYSAIRSGNRSLSAADTLKSASDGYELEDHPPYLPPPPIIESTLPPPPPPPLSEDLSFTRESRGSTPQYTQTLGISSNISTISNSRSSESEDDNKKKVKRYPVDRAYFIAKELLMTERTYRKDLEVITKWFRLAVSTDESVPDYLENLFRTIDPIYEFHCGFLKEVEQRLSMWEGKSNAHLNGDYQKIGDIMVGSFLRVLEHYMNYFERQEDILLELEQALKDDKDFEQIYKDFETKKVCYLPLNTFLLKPCQRLLHLKLLLERITKHYAPTHPDYNDCKSCLSKLSDLTQTFRDQRKSLENLQKLIELQRDLVGLDTLVHPDREFIREGCLQKFSRKGYQQRMFFLFSDMLVYTSRTATPLLQFKVHGQLPLRGMIVEESDHAKMAVANSFAIYGGNKCILVAASSQEEKDKWIEDLNEAIQASKNRNDDKLRYASLKSSTSSTENMDTAAQEDKAPSTMDKQIQHRANTTMHVCWHRNTSVSKRDHEKAVKNQLSGYLLRKFKNSNGWQKLWVVFTNFCLYFYKTYQDDFPLASLPLLGYAVSTPDEEDGIHKDHVFKLQFKNHVYFFRAESEYTFERWVEVINSATNSARRVRLFSRMDSKMPGD